MTAIEIVDVIKSLIRPVIILSGWGTWLYMIILGIAVPTALAGVIALITGEYFVERGYQRFKGK